MERRDIKFRAWDGTDYMTKPFTLLDIQNGKIQFASSDTIIMQFTGLKDKNGKEIYEGDVVRGEMQYPFSEKGKIEIGVVAYCTRECRFRVVSGNDGNEAFTGLQQYGGFIKIIGNIHQHPELITK